LETRTLGGFNAVRYGEAVANVVSDLVKGQGYDKVIAPSTAFGKDVVPRVGGLLDVQPITDVVSIIVRSVLMHSLRKEELSS